MFSALRVLVIEDHPFQRLFVENKLRALGVDNVEGVGSGHDAVRALRQRQFDLVLCDIHMPDGNGPELLAELLSRGRDAFVGSPPVWVWVSKMPRDLLESHKVMASGHIFPSVHALRKPLHTEALKDALQEALDVAHRGQAGATRQSAPTRQELRQLAANPQALKIMLQPQFDLVTGRLAGAEALCRWQHPRLGFLSPDRFVQVMEDLGIADSPFSRSQNRHWRLGENCLRPAYASRSASTPQPRHYASRRS